VSNYQHWIGNFLNIFVGDLIFYTNSLGLSMFPALKQKPNIQTRLIYSSPFDYPCMRHLKTVYEAQVKIDPEATIHKPELYAIWNGKCCLTKEVSDEFWGAVVFWIDSGSMREDIYRRIRFPNTERLNQLFPTGTNGKMVFAFGERSLAERMYPIHIFRRDYVIGTFFGGDYKAIHWFYTVFWKVHDYFLGKGEFVGKEQNLMAVILVFASPTWIQPNYLARGCDPWFSTFSFYSNTTLCFSSPPSLENSTMYITGDSVRRTELSFLLDG
jgi:hypothetical protein